MRQLRAKIRGGGGGDDDRIENAKMITLRERERERERGTEITFSAKWAGSLRRQVGRARVSRAGGR